MKFVTLVTAAFVLFVAWAGSPVSLAERRPRSFLGQWTVTAEAGETYGSLSAVNGNVRVGRGVIADRAKTVNGEIEVEERRKAW